MATTAAREKKPTWRERFAALRYVGPFVKLVWSTHRSFATTMFALRITRALTPIAQLVVIQRTLDAIFAGLKTHHPDWRRILGLVATEFGVVVVAELLARGSILIESLLGDLFTNRISVRIMEHAGTLDLAQFEDPAFYDLLERTRKETVGRIGVLTQILAMGQDVLTLLTLIAPLLMFNPWLFLVLTLSILPNLAGQTHFAAMGYSLLYKWTPERRLLDYLRFLAASDRTAKEVQMFSLSTWLTDRYRTLAHRFYEANRDLSIRRARVSAGLSLLGTVGYFTAYVLIVVDAARGIITIGTWYLLVGTFSQSRDILQRLLLQGSDVYEQALFLRDLFVFFDIRPTLMSRPGAQPVPRPLRVGFVFEDVGFRYPGSERWAVRHINFRLGPGERIALVGENGAGKTTITKLLARLYDPTEGRILLEGIDLRDYDLASLRDAIGVIFQDFVRYDLAFDENIGVGQIDQTRGYLDQAESAFSAFESRRGDGAVPRTNGASVNGEHLSESVSSPLDATEDRLPASNGAVHSPVPPFEPIVRAAEKSLAATLLPRLPMGYRQMLGRRFQGGVDLSGGEWQKVALARAYLRDAQVLILDEPTAALDARSEYEVFLQFSELVAGRMAVLISHRFSTVRMADRIVVLQTGAQGGEIVEEGTHEELIAKSGLYGELFAMQAAGYR